MAQKDTIRFRDLPQRESDAYRALTIQQAQLNSRGVGGLTPEERETLLRVNGVLTVYAADPSPAQLVDPLFVAVRAAFNANPGLIGKLVLNHADGELRAAALRAANARANGIVYDDAVKIALVFGLLADDEVEAPRVAVEDDDGEQNIVSDVTDPSQGAFAKAFFAAYGEMEGMLPLARLVLAMLRSEGDNDGRGGNVAQVESVEFASVMRCLRGKGVDETEPQLRRRINECLDSIQRVGGDVPLSDIQIALPDLNGISNYQVQAENVRLMGSIICAAMLEELKAFQVVERLVEMSQGGTLPVGRGRAGELLYRYWKETPNRMSEAERRNFYAVTIGIPGGDANGQTNREFNDLWIRFVSSVSSLVRQKAVDRLLQQTIPASIGQQQVRKAARDLALNLSSHGYGMALYAAIDLQGEIKKIIDLLGDREIMGAFGARDMWQVIDQVATLELGGAKNSARYRTLATCGAIITSWLGNNVRRLNQSSTRPVIDLVAVTSDDPPTAGPKATSTPTDYDLVNACELWLADTAVSDDRIEQLSQPRESPVMTSKPVQIPSIARDLLEQAGVPGLGLSLARR